MNYTVETKITSLEVNKEDDSVYNVFFEILVTKGTITKSKKTYRRVP
jgi:hypothetical protein